MPTKLVKFYTEARKCTLEKKRSKRTVKLRIKRKKRIRLHARIQKVLNDFLQKCKTMNLKFRITRNVLKLSVFISIFVSRSVKTKNVTIK